MRHPLTPSSFRVRHREQPATTATGEEGMAVVMVVIISMLMLMLCTALLASAVAAEKISHRNRQRVPAIAGAEAVVDLSLAALVAAPPTALPCTFTRQLPGNPDPVTATAQIAYTDTTGASWPALGCTPTGAGEGVTATWNAGSLELTGATITATGTVTATPGAVGAPVQRAMTAKVALSAPAALFPSALHSDTGLELLNRLEIRPGVDAAGVPVPAPVTTWGDFSCKNSADVRGPVTALGRLELLSACTITGDAYAGGDITTNADAVTIGGSLLSGGGATTFGQAGITVGKDVRSAGAITGAGLSKSTIGGQVVPHAGPFPPPALATPLPVVTRRPDHFPGYHLTSWAAVVSASRATNGATGATTDPCTLNGSQAASLNGPLRTPATPTIIDAAACTTGVTAKNVIIDVNADTVIWLPQYPTGTSTALDASGLTLRNTAADGQPRTVRIIVPWQDATPTSTCTNQARTPGGITYNAAGLATPADLRLFLYSPGAITLANSTNFHGQAYGCQVNLANAATITYAPVGASTRPTQYALLGAPTKYEP